MTSFTLSGTQHWDCKKKLNPSVNKLLWKYSFVLEMPETEHSIRDVVEWQNKGGGRDWYEGTSIGLKMLKRNPIYNVNITEWDLWQHDERVRVNTPRCYGRFLVSAPEHSHQRHVLLDVLVQDRLGPSLGRLLSELCADQSSWNHATALQVVRLWSNTLALADALEECLLGWTEDFDVRSACLSLCGERMLCCNWDSDGKDFGPGGNMMRALKKLSRSSNILLRDSSISWQSFHQSLFHRLLAVGMAGIQNRSEWWHPIMIEVLTEYGPPPMVVIEVLTEYGPPPMVVNSLNPTSEAEEDDGWLVVPDNVNTN
jgi:hypothetical protein